MQPQILHCVLDDTAAADRVCAEFVYFAAIFLFFTGIFLSLVGGEPFCGAILRGGEVRWAEVLGDQIAGMNGIFLT